MSIELTDKMFVNYLMRQWNTAKRDCSRSFWQNHCRYLANHDFIITIMECKTRYWSILRCYLSTLSENELKLSSEVFGEIVKYDCLPLIPERRKRTNQLAKDSSSGTMAKDVKTSTDEVSFFEIIVETLKNWPKYGEFHKSDFWSKVESEQREQRAQFENALIKKKNIIYPTHVKPDDVYPIEESDDSGTPSPKSGNSDDELSIFEGIDFPVEEFSELRKYYGTVSDDFDLYCNRIEMFLIQLKASTDR